jgi:hypothetical protein
MELFHAVRVLDVGTFDMSGVMLAAPAIWITNLLSKHGVKSKEMQAGKFVIH